MLTLYAIVQSLDNRLSFVKGVNYQVSFFENTDKNSTIIIGRKTWFSIPQSVRVSIKKSIIVLTRDKTMTNVKTEEKKQNVKFMDFKTFLKNDSKRDINYAILGGITVYKLFMDTNCINKLVLISKTNKNINNLEFATPLDLSDFHVETISPVTEKEYRIQLCNNRIQFSKQKTLKNALSKLKLGKRNISQTTNTDTNKDKLITFFSQFSKNGFVDSDLVKNFGMSISLDIEKSLPVFSQFSPKDCIHKLLWDLQGNTREGGVNIGWEWRFFGANYSRAFSDVKQIDTNLIGGHDQIKTILEKLTNWDKRVHGESIVLTSWNSDITKLPPRNHFIQFYPVNNSELHCHIYSCKLNLQTQFQRDIVYYSLLLSIFAKKSNLIPKTITFSYGEVYHPISCFEFEFNISNAIFFVPDIICYKDFIEMTSSDFDVVLL
jgi:dihydrofolate reductase